MRLARLISAGLLIFLTGCVTAPKDEPNSSTPHDLTDAEKHRIKSDLLVALKTPDALFSTVRAVVSRSGKMTVRGWVRVKSDFPDYPRYPSNSSSWSLTRMRNQLRDFRLVHLPMSRAKSRRCKSYARRSEFRFDRGKGAKPPTRPARDP